MAGKSMREVSEWDELKTFFDRRLIEALGHPVREHILAAGGDGSTERERAPEQKSSQASSL